MAALRSPHACRSSFDAVDVFRTESPSSPSALYNLRQSVSTSRLSRPPLAFSTHQCFFAFSPQCQRDCTGKATLNRFRCRRSSRFGVPLTPSFSMDTTRRSALADEPTETAAHFVAEALKLKPPSASRPPRSRPRARRVRAMGDSLNALS